MNPHAVATRIAKHATTDAAGCWLWGGALNAKGYARVRFGGREFLAHRLAYEAHVGPIPAGLTLDHLCRVRNCVNPQHLEPVPAAENVLRGVGITAANARKTRCKHGHDFTPENTHYRPNGHRSCRQCMREVYGRRAA